MAVGVATVCFATSGPLAFVAKPAHPLLIAAGRTAIAAALLSLLSPRTTLAAFRAASARTLLLVCAAGAVLAAHFGFFLAGLASTSLPAAVTLVSLEPVAVVLTAWLAFGTKPRALELLGVALATQGALVLAGGAGRGEHRLSGDLMVVVAVILYGGYLALARALADRMPPLAYATLVYASSAALLTVASLAVHATFTLPARSVLAIAALGVVPTLGGHTIVQWAARHVSPAVVALVSPGETLGSLLIAAFLLGQTPSWFEMGGAALVLCGLTATLLGQRASSAW